MSSSACSCSSLVCAPWQKTRPTVSGAHSAHSVLFCSFSKVFCFVLVFCLSRGKEVAARPPAIAHCRTAWEFGGIATSPHARRSREISAAAVALSSPDSMPAGSPLTHARRIAADSCPRIRRWLKPTGLAVTHARWPPLTLAPWIQSTRHGQECRVCLVVPTGTF